MINALVPLFRGDFEVYRDVLVLADDPRPALSYDALLEPHSFDDLLRFFAERYKGDDRRALVSMWAKHYIVRLLPPVMGATLLLRWRLPLALTSTAIILDELQIPQAFLLRGGGEPFATDLTDPFELFSGLLDEHLAPLFHAMASQGKLSQKVLWSNVGNYFENFLTLMERSGMPTEHLVLGRTLLETKTRPNGTRNPLYRPVRYVARSDKNGQPSLHRQRRVCCVRYLMPDFELCCNCPLTVKPVKRTCALSYK
ncbi:MAG: siderophore-iron reductase FhuF [Pseudomonas sp.]|nr:siderophore-iron reductase FhuF [Pseudomonas sp.]